MPEELPITDTGTPARALEALDRAVACAETGLADRPIVVASPADWKSASGRLLSDLRSRLDRVMMGKDPEAGLEALLACGALEVLLPEVKNLVGFGDGEWRHKDVWKHTKQVVRQSVPRLEVRWAALFHDNFVVARLKSQGHPMQPSRNEASLAVGLPK